MLVFENNFAHISPADMISAVCKMGSTINEDYICDLLADENCELVFYSFDTGSTNVDILNCPCSLIYKVCYDDDGNINIYILFIATAYSFRGLGYASTFMKEFVSHMCNQYGSLNIILNSVIESVTFYEHIGFKWVTEGAEQYYEALEISEDDEEEHFIMVSTF